MYSRTSVHFSENCCCILMIINWTPKLWVSRTTLFFTSYIFLSLLTNVFSVLIAISGRFLLLRKLVIVFGLGVAFYFILVITIPRNSPASLITDVTARIISSFDMITVYLILFTNKLFCFSAATLFGTLFLRAPKNKEAGLGKRSINQLTQKKARFMYHFLVNEFGPD